MSKVISLISQKGGVGKSTVARLLAVEAARAGLGVRLCDLDANQGTSVHWKTNRDRNEIDPDIAVEKCRTVRAALAYRDDTDVLILDMPPFMDARSGEAAKASDLVILPTQPAEDDLRAQVVAAYELMDAGVPSAQICFVLCKTRGSQAEVTSAVDYLRSTGVAVMDPAMKDQTSVSYALNQGGAPSETSSATVNARMKTLASHLLLNIGIDI